MKTKLFSLLFMLFFLFAKGQVTFLTPYATAVTSTTANINVYMSLGNTYFISYQIATSSAGVAGSASLGSQNTFAGSYNLVKSLTSLTPNTTYYFRFKASDGTASTISSFTTLPLSPVISNVSAIGISNNGATIAYTLNAQGFNTTSIVKYGLSATTMTNQVTGISASGTSDTNANVPLTGLNYNTQYYYQVEAVNANGTTTSQPLGTFITVVPSPTTEYTFDNTYNNTVGTNPFSSTNTSFVTDRHGNSTGAVQLAGAQSTATIPSTLLPTGANVRTISFWYKTNSNSGYPGVFAYGANANSQTFGMYLNPNGGPVFQGFSNDTDFGGSYAANTWQHVVISYGGGVIKMYKNGAYISSVNKNLNTALSAFKLGNSSVGMTFDDLKIYNFVLTDSEVTNLFNYNSLGTPQMATINTITKKPAAINSTIYATVSDNGSAISSVVVKYGLTSGNLNNQVNAVTILSTNYYGAIINGLAENTTYYYKVEVTNAGGVTSSSEDTFTTGSKQTVAEYSFDNVYTNILGNNAFASSAGTSFGTDRNGNPNSTLVVNNTTVNGQIPGLPVDASTRTVSIWAKINSNTNSNYPFSYGGIFSDLAFIAEINNNTLGFLSYGNSFLVNESNPVNTWMHLVYTYDGVNVKMYKNGTLIGTSPFNLFTTFDDNYFYLANVMSSANTFNGAVDDLKIYNYPLTQTEITNLYNNNSLSSSDFNQNNLKVALYPNPVHDILNINIENEIKSVEIYTIQGQKVLASNQKQINVSNLNAGIYLVHVQDMENKGSTQKIIVK